MKIGIDISQAQYPGTGVGNYTSNLTSTLLNLKTDHQIILLGFSLRGQQPLKDLANQVKTPLKLYPIPQSIGTVLFNKIRLPHLETFTGKLDVFHSSDWLQPKTAAFKVTTIHDLTTILYPKHHDQTIISNHANRLRLVKNEVDLIIADSHSTKNDIAKHLEINPDKVQVVHLAPDPIYNNFASQSASYQSTQISKIKKKYQLEKYILNVGTNEPRKNKQRIIKAVNQLNKKYKKPIQLALAGGLGWGEQSKSAQSNHIKQLGFVPTQDLPALYAGASAFVFPSLYEGFGLPVLEAMAIGTPVVTSNRGSLEEVAGSAAIRVNPLSTKDISLGIKKALSNRERLISLGKTQSKKFSWEKTAKQTLNVYEQASKQKK